MKALREALAEAKANNTAIGHFNFANIEMFWAIIRAAEKVGKPVILGVAEGERDFIGIPEAVALVESARKHVSVSLYLNADHTYSVPRVKEAIDAGFDAVIFDGAKLPFEENIQATRECVMYAKTSMRDVLVEGEVGFIGSGSQMLDSVPPGAIIDESLMTTTAEAKRFVEETGVDLFAPAVGNIHGMLKNMPEPALSPTRVKEIAETVASPLVLHGASGNSDDDIRNSIASGIRIVHVSTELRRAYRDAMQQSLVDNPNELAPYKLMKPVVEAVEAVVENRLRLFSNL